MSYNTYKPNEVEINWLILAKLTKFTGLDINIPLLAEELKILFSNMSELKIEELLDQVFSINKDLYKFLIIILNDETTEETTEETTDENYKNYVALLKTIKELFIFTGCKNYLSSCNIWKIDKNPIDFNIFKKLVDYMSDDLSYFRHLSPNELRNVIMSMKKDEKLQILKYFFDFNEDFYWLFQKILFHEEWNFHEYCYKNVEEEIDELDYSEFENMLESTIRLIYYACVYKFDYKFKRIDYDYKLLHDIRVISLLSQKDLITHVSKMSLNEFEHLIKILYQTNEILFSYFERILLSGFMEEKHSRREYEKFKDLLIP
jgi:hypothetical protein